MFPRIVKLPTHQSFFLFGARGTGKSTLLRSASAGLRALHYDLLDAAVDDRLRRDPGALEADVVAALRQGPLESVVIDEVQKAPRLLDVVHRLIEGRGIRFMLSGSSARKLRRGGANLLAGRAVVRHLHPLTAAELGEDFDLDLALASGTLPGIVTEADPEVRADRLRAYAWTYLKEEVAAEQIVRSLDPFRAFLGVAAQMNGKPINTSAIARDVGLRDHKSVASWFEVLEDTLIGFRLPAWHGSLRKAQRASPKFFLFDPGVKRALDRTLDVPLHPQTSAYGEAFEHLVIADFWRTNEALSRDWALAYLQSKDGAEVDLVLDRPRRRIFVEIKSSERVDPVRLGRFARLVEADPTATGYYLSRDPHPQERGGIRCLPWRDGIREILEVPALR